jgi:hypothetical protein
MQEYVTLSVAEAEIVAATNFIQDMLHMWNTLNKNATVK